MLPRQCAYVIVGIIAAHVLAVTPVNGKKRESVHVIKSDEDNARDDTDHEAALPSKKVLFCKEICTLGGKDSGELRYDEKADRHHCVCLMKADATRHAHISRNSEVATAMCRALDEQPLREKLSPVPQSAKFVAHKVLNKQQKQKMMPFPQTMPYALPGSAQGGNGECAGPCYVNDDLTTGCKWSSGLLSSAEYPCGACTSWTRTTCTNLCASRGCATKMSHIEGTAHKGHIIKSRETWFAKCECDCPESHPAKYCFKNVHGKSQRCPKNDPCFIDRHGLSTPKCGLKGRGKMGPSAGFGGKGEKLYLTKSAKDGCHLCGTELRA